MGVRAIGDSVQLRQQRRHLPGSGGRLGLACEGIDGTFNDGCFCQAGGASQPFDLCNNNGICNLQRHEDCTNVDLLMINIHQHALVFKVSFRAGGFASCSHSIVPGGFDVTSYTTRLTPLTSLMIRVAVSPWNFMSNAKS
jgi:hypothetical protein